MTAILVALLLQLLIAKNVPVISPVADFVVVKPQVLAQHQFSLNNRYDDPFVNRVFRENILLTLAYMRKVVAAGKPVDWALVDRPFHWTLALSPGQTVSYHALRLPEYQSAVPLTELNFNSFEGFLSDGWLVGDGVCHLASLLAWAARDAGLSVEAPTNHDFAKINEVPKAQGVSIYSMPSAALSSALQNLYIKNNKGKTVELVFDYQGDELKISVVEVASKLAQAR